MMWRPPPALCARRVFDSRSWGGVWKSGHWSFIVFIFSHCSFGSFSTYVCGLSFVHWHWAHEPPFIHFTFYSLFILPDCLIWEKSALQTARCCLSHTQQLQVHNCTYTTATLNRSANPLRNSSVPTFHTLEQQTWCPPHQPPRSVRVIPPRLWSTV